MIMLKFVTFAISFIKLQIVDQSLTDVVITVKKLLIVNQV